MMHLSQAAKAVHGEIKGADVLFSEVSKDTRDIHEGALYVALKGERFDGHDFVEQAAKRGAVAALVSEQQAASIPQVCVGDTRMALGQLAASWRSQFMGRVIGITGSNGKTTVKEMCRAVLVEAAGAEHVLSTQGNLNNDIGVPMTVLSLRDEHAYAVIEMGANHAGEIDYLTHIAKPHVAMITNAGPAHLEGFGSIEKVAQAKAEIYSGLTDEGIAIINADDTYADFWRSLCSDRIVLSFSTSDPASEVYAAVDKPVTQEGLQVRTPAGKCMLRLNVPGIHNLRNALAAITAGIALEIPLDVIEKALNAFDSVSGRLAMLKTPRGLQVINDSYNANPQSLHAGMQVLADTARKAGSQSWLVLGDMAELGDEAAALHAEAGRQAKKLGIRHVLATGDLSRHAAAAFGSEGRFFEDRQQLIDHLKQDTAPADVVLVKGSRFMRMEEIVHALVGGSADNNKKSHETGVH